MSLYAGNRKVIESGVVYICGRDNKYRPVIYIDG